MFLLYLNIVEIFLKGSTMNIIRKEKFIFVDSKDNHNKFWYIEEYDNGMIRTTWGRVGNKEVVSEKMFGSTASKEYDKLVKSKLKKGYTKLNTIDDNSSNLSNLTLESVALNEINYDKNNMNITNMIKYFCEKNIHKITSNTSIVFDKNSNVFQTPCGIVTAESILEAGELLDKINDNYTKYGFCPDKVINYVEDYCKLIPQKIKGRFEVYKIFPNISSVKNQYDILDSLNEALELIADMNDANITSTKLFNTSIVEVTDDKIITKINNKFKKTHQSIHACRNLKVKRVFEIQIDKMNNDYNSLRNQWIKSGKRKNTKQLWHGTTAANIISILKNGFIIPPANAKHVTGRMFGSSGLYLTDQSTKALNYAYGWWSGIRDKNCFMFLCDVMCGEQYIPKSSCSTIPSGYDSIFAKAGYSGVQNNEMIVPLNQVNPKYIIEFFE
jgi:poly [ADP-ribose] polymerase